MRWRKPFAVYRAYHAQSTTAAHSFPKQLRLLHRYALAPQDPKNTECFRTFNSSSPNDVALPTTSSAANCFVQWYLTFPTPGIFIAVCVVGTFNAWTYPPPPPPPPATCHTEQKETQNNWPKRQQSILFSHQTSPPTNSHRPQDKQKLLLQPTPD